MTKKVQAFLAAKQRIANEPIMQGNRSYLFLFDAKINHYRWIIDAPASELLEAALNVRKQLGE